MFAPRPGSHDELDGYYLAFVNSSSEERTVLDVWDAAEFPGPPRAQVRLPNESPTASRQLVRGLTD